MGCVGRWRNTRAWIDRMAEGADDSEQLLMSVPWIRRRLEHYVRGLVDRVAGSVERVIQTAASSRRINEEVLRSSARCRRKHREPSPADRCLWAFHGQAHRGLPSHIL